MSRLQLKQKAIIYRELKVLRVKRVSRHHKALRMKVESKIHSALTNQRPKLPKIWFKGIQENKPTLSIMNLTNYLQSPSNSKT